MQPGSKKYLTQWMVGLFDRSMTHSGIQADNRKKHDIWRNKFLFCAVMAGEFLWHEAPWLNLLTAIQVSSRSSQSCTFQLSAQSSSSTKAFHGNGLSYLSQHSCSLLVLRFISGASGYISGETGRDLRRATCLSGICPPTRVT